MKISTKVKWKKNSSDNFTNGKYSRVHQWEFDGGMKISASASPEIVPVPMSDPAFIDPEEAFLASVSSCHMLFFLSIAAKKKISIEKYEDNPTAYLGKNESGASVIHTIKLEPHITFNNSFIPEEKEIENIHRLAHSNCFIANSIKAEIIFSKGEN